MKFLKLSQEDGSDVWVNCDKILCMHGDDSKSQTATVIHMQGLVGTKHDGEVRVKQALSWIRRTAAALD
jgi:hypothetical protein